MGGTGLRAGRLGRQGRRPHPVRRKAALSGKLAYDTVFVETCTKESG